MKKRYIQTLLRLLSAAAVVTVVTACISNFEEYNHNPNETTDKELERDNYNVGAKLLQLQNTVVPTEEHIYQFAEAVTGISYGGYGEGTKPEWGTAGKFSTFNPPVDWIKAPFVTPMTDTYAPYRGIRIATDDPVPLALADILRVAIMHRLTDQYGPIPYSQVADNKEGLLTVSYDSQQDVYNKMFAELDAAVAVLDDNRELSTEAFGEYDQVYGGNISKWILFANSLKLRMAMRLTEVDPDTAKDKAREAIDGGVIESNADNAKFQPVLNRGAMIWNDWKDHVISADLDSYMTGYNDPRIPKMFTLVDVVEYPGPTYEPVNVTKLRGLRIGATPLSKENAIATCSFPVISDTDPYMWMNAAEVAFLRAEWELRWGTMAEAGAHYKSGVELSFEQWGAGSAEEYLATDAIPAKYSYPELMTDVQDTSFAPASTITPVWNDGDELETALERIITQKWIAMFPLGTEAWAEYRRTGYPRLAPVPDECNRSGGTVTPKWGARRLQYPAEEYTENRANVTEAVTNKLGGADNFGSRVWWDKKKLN